MALTFGNEQGGSVVPNDGLWDDEVMVSEVMSTVGGRLCYVYA